MPTESALTERLRAALDRAEEIARATEVSDGPDQWWSANDLGAHVDEADTTFIVANGPAHVLRTVAAHRKILARHHTGGQSPWTGDMTRRCVTCFQGFPCESVRDLASIYFPEAPDGT